MIDVMRAFMMVEHGADGVADPDGGNAGYMRVLNAERGPQKTSDGWIMILPYGADAYDSIFKFGGREDLVGDSRTRGRGPMTHAKYLYAQLRPIIARHKTADWFAFCRRNKIPVGAVAGLDDVVRHYPVVEHPIFGSYRSVTSAVQFSTTPAKIKRPAPMLGEHTDEILREIGLNDSSLAVLDASGIIRRRLSEA